MNCKKLVVCFISFFTFFFGEIIVNVACGPEVDPYDYFISFFHNNIQGDEYQPFSFTDMLYIYRDEEIASEADINSTEWARYLKVKPKDVRQVMYQTDSSANQKLFLFNGRSTQMLPDSLKNNTFLIALTKNRKAFNYYSFAKSCEPFASADYDPWDPEIRDSIIMIKKARAALDSISTVKNDDFLQFRYAYQAQRILRYAGNFEESRTVYEKLIANRKTSSAAKGWALSLYAGAVNDKYESAYLFTKVFASSPERRIQAYRNYFSGPNSPIDSVLKFAKNKSEVANIWAINGFRDPQPNMQPLENVYKNDPTSLLNGALLTREVNKLEQNLLEKQEIALDYFTNYSKTWRYNNLNTDSIKNVNLKHLATVRTFALKLAADHRYPQPTLGTITAAYLSWIEGDHTKALQYLSTIQNPTILNDRLKSQYQIVNLLIYSTKLQKGSSFNENQMLKTLKWLDEKRYLESTNRRVDDYTYDSKNHYTKTTRDFYQQVLAPAYMKMGDTAKAAMAMLKGDLNSKKIKDKTIIIANMSFQTTSFWHHYLSSKTMRRLTDFKSIHQTDAYNNFLTHGIKKLDYSEFYELYGTCYLREHQYAKALQIFNKVPKSHRYFISENFYDDEKTFANPFIERLTDYPKAYLPADAGINKKTFAQKMLRLQRLINTDKKNAAQYYFQLANAVYQTGHFGNSWYLIRYSWNADDLRTSPKYEQDKDFILAKTAKQWYLKARMLSKNANFKAKCTFMLAKCEQKALINNFYIKDRKSWYKNDKLLKVNVNNPYFKELKKNHQHTDFYKIAVNECSYFREFLQPNPKATPTIPTVIVVD